MKELRLHWLQHVPFEGIGCIQAWAERNGYVCSKSELYNGDIPPDPDDVDLLVIAGGPMGVYDEDEYPWLRKEKRYIARMLSSGSKMLGICLGAQMIATVMGAGVYRSKYREIGWHRVALTDEARGIDVTKGWPSSFNAFHWHGDTFKVPEGCVHLAQSEACLNQGFIFEDRVVALQFHLESSKSGIEDLIANCSDDMAKGEYVQTRTAIRSGFNKANAGLMEVLLENMSSSLVR